MSVQRIAVIDGSPDLSEGLVGVLCAHGHDAYVVAGTPDASTHVLARGADTVLVGIELRQSEGRDLALALRAGGYGGRVIALGNAWDISANPDASYFDEHWEKPLRPEQVLAFASSSPAMPDSAGQSAAARRRDPTHR